MENSPDFNKFLSIQLKIQKARDGFEVKLLTPIEFEAILYLTYDLRQFIVKPTGAYPAFDYFNDHHRSFNQFKSNRSSSVNASTFCSFHFIFVRLQSLFQFYRISRIFESNYDSISYDTSTT